jgi:hypothetical protein
LRAGTAKEYIANNTQISFPIMKVYLFYYSFSVSLYSDQTLQARLMEERRQYVERLEKEAKERKVEEVKKPRKPVEDVEYILSHSGMFLMMYSSLIESILLSFSFSFLFFLSFFSFFFFFFFLFSFFFFSFFLFFPRPSHA